MKNLIFLVALAACGNKSSTPIANSGSGSEPVGPVKDTRTELEKRRDTACESLGPRITVCAVEDARKELAAGKVKQKDFDANTTPEVQKKNTAEFIKACQKSQYSSRQVRVLEVCQREESQCEPLLACLDNLNNKE
ncbi:MAG TPA: hypothetical protein VIV40_20160 [Kofleriaceae bacterium]